jgi:hypothetical protein
LGFGARCLRNSTLSKKALSPYTPNKKNKKTTNNNTTPIVSFIFEYIARFWHAPAKNLGFWNLQFGGGNCSVANSFRNWRKSTCVLIWTKKTHARKDIATEKSTHQ